MEKTCTITLNETEALVLRKAIMLATTHASENENIYGNNADMVIDLLWLRTIKRQLRDQDIDLTQEVDFDKIYEEM